MPAAPQQPEIETVGQLLTQFQQLERQLQEVREGLLHSHRLATLGTIASIIAHEYNNILTPIISYAHLALSRPDDHETLVKAVERALSGAERAARISSSLLGFAREADAQHAAPLRRTIDDAVACLGRDLDKDGITLTTDVPDVQVAMPPLNLQQVFVNLLLNARKVMGTGGRLDIRGQASRGMVHISVADTGPGIPEEIRHRLFEPFVTQPVGSNGQGGERKGTGLGLAICRDLLRNAGGDISVDSQPGRGATFQLAIPKADDLFEST